MTNLNNFHASVGLANPVAQKPGKDLLTRVLAFKSSLQRGPVKVSLYGADQDWPTLRKIIACVAILASGVAGQQLNEKDHSLSRQLAPTFSLEQACGKPAGKLQEDQDTDAIRLIEVNYLGKKAMAIDEASRIRLSKAAAQMHSLNDVGLGWEDVYGVISAETAWIPRTGMGRNKVASYGLAQFEPATAKAIGVVDPHDPVHAVHGAAALIKEAAQWSKSKISHLRLSPAALEAKLREGISVYYNLSSSARRQWNGANLADLPLETQYHVANFKDGRLLGKAVEKRLLRPAANVGGPQDAPRLLAVSVHAGSDLARQDVELCRASLGAALAMASQTAMAPDLIVLESDEASRTYVKPQLMVSALQDAAQEHSVKTSWKGFVASVYQQTSFDIRTLELGTSLRDIVSKGAAQLASGWVLAESWVDKKGASTALQRACGIVAFQRLSASRCARWTPETALDIDDGQRTTVLAALTLFKHIRDEAPTPKGRDRISRALVNQIGSLNGGGDVQKFVHLAMTLHDFVGDGQTPDQPPDLAANARFIQALVAEGYTITDILRLYRAALDARLIDGDVRTLTDVVSNVWQHHRSAVHDMGRDELESMNQQPA